MRSSPVSPLWQVCLIVGLAGFALGALRVPTWQDAVEPAQVLAGLVVYPPGAPVHEYSVGTWTVWHHLLSVALRAGVSERLASVIVSGLLGALSLQALAVVVFLLSGDRRLAVAITLLVYWANASAPAALMGVVATYGVTGASWTLLGTALLGAGRLRSAGVMIGLSPAIHPAWGVFTLTATAITWLWPGPRTPIRSSQFVRASTVGVIAAFASAAWHWRVSGRWPFVTPDVLPDSHLTLVQLWDAHRIVVDWVSYRAASAAIAGGLAIWWLTRRAAEPSRGWLRLLTVLLAMAFVLSQAYAVPELSPWWLLALMPSRLIDVGPLVCTVLIAGLAARQSSDGRQHLLVTCLLAALIMLGSAQAGVGSMFEVAYLQAAAAAWFVWCVRTPHLAAPVTATLRRWRTAAMAATATLATVWLGVTVVDARHVHREGFAIDAALMAARGRPGLLLTAGEMHLVQAITRRPVLLDGGALDGLSYVPQALPQAVRILDRVYGVTFLHPPGVLAEERRGALGSETGRDLWERRSREAWQTVAAEFGVTDVVTPIEWRLHLPVAARGREYVLWTLPLPAGT